MFPQLIRSILVGALLWLSLAPRAGAADPVPEAHAGEDSTVEPVRMSVPAFGTTAEVEIRGQPREVAAAAARAALQEIYELSRLFDPDGDVEAGIGALNRAAGDGEQEVHPQVGELLLRSLQFCIWSTGAYGPLGGELYHLWEERPKRPDPYEIRQAVGSAECSRIALKPGAHGKKPVAVLIEGSRIEPYGLDRGLAVDRAVEVLREHGKDRDRPIDNAWVEIGNVWRAMGEGPEGRGWLAELPPVPGESEPLDEVWLKDQSLAVLSLDPVKGEPFRPVIDQRTGVPSRGVIMVVAVTVLAADAHPLATTLFTLGHREGQMRLGTLDPRPSVYWLLGEGYGRPLESTYLWTQVERVRRR